MKTSVLMLTALCLIAPLAAQASCETVKADISKKIVSNGVTESGFTLDIVPNDQADQAGGQVVGHCENDTQKIVYKRITSDGDASVPADAGSTQDAPAP
ncbi:DUF1161 domain-containing protein [Erwiniaceae bacterium BAC15a-03b]|uniref:DUF1161 domain-containing protein n=1 Tax=Winslowiella arboricola TaxID=2978220 RepID=A0A9J6PSW2_9GAMM|nr:DUF1161 domain-containing protein [Winslowiella arboricola]MCU5772417.1 DUF1161 domain-containing protein [Winslowiella arboricola]MCU5779790.1 DUF1161 domain-containing protein [Winslowiella arboricola]